MPLDVVLVSQYPAPGRTHDGTSGVASYTANFARALTAQGARVAVVAPDERDAPAKHSDSGVTVVRSGPLGTFALTRAVAMAAGMHPDVIHLQHELFLFGGVSSLAGLPLAVGRLRSFEGTTITTVHQVVGGEDMSPGMMMRLHRLRGPVAAARMATTGYHRLIASAGLPIVHEARFATHIPNAVVIPHGVERRSTPNRDRARRKLRIERERRLVVLCFGFVAPYKGLELALATAADVPEVLLVVAGGDHPRHGSEYTNALRNRWRDTAFFTGWVPEEDVEAWHSAADLALFCYPAPHSSSGAVAVALAHGTPILASDALVDCMGLPRELAVTSDRAALAGRLRHLAANRESLAELRTISLRIAAGRSWSDVAKRHLRLYEDVSAGPSARTVGVQGGWGQLEAV